MTMIKQCKKHGTLKKEEIYTHLQKDKRRKNNEYLAQICKLCKRDFARERRKVKSEEMNETQRRSYRKKVAKIKLTEKFLINYTLYLNELILKLTKDK